MPSIKCGHCKETHDSLHMVRECSIKESKSTMVVLVPVTEPGMYRKPNGIVYKVKWNKQGTYLYASKMKEVTPHNKKTLAFEYIYGAIKELTADMRMTLADVAEIGLKTGICCVCGRMLTNKVSVEAGIGPICAGRI